MVKRMQQRFEKRPVTAFVLTGAYHDYHIVAGKLLSWCIPSGRNNANAAGIRSHSAAASHGTRDRP